MITDAHADVPEGTTLWVCIAAYNEGAVIGDVVRNVRGQYPNVVVVDDGSSDDTAERALAAGAVVVPHPINLGQGAALQTGLRFACGEGADYLVTFDADGQHKVEEIAVLMAYHRQTGADAVLGSRFLGQTVGMSLGRRALLKAATMFTRLTTRMKLTDAHNGFRLLGRKLINRRRGFPSRARRDSSSETGAFRWGATI